MFNRMNLIRRIYYVLVSQILVSLARARTSHRYAAPIRQDRIVWISPTEIVQKPTHKPPTNILPYKLVVDGDWDQDRSPIEDDPVYSAFYKRFIEQEPWKSTGYIDFLKTDISVHGGLSCEEAIARCDEIDVLARYIRDNGYGSQRTLEREDELIDRLCDRKLPPEYREISVSIARDGSFLWHAGMHRLVLAKLFNVEQIPVRINARHRQWQAIRDSVWMNQDDGTYHDHPDIEYLYDD